MKDQFKEIKRLYDIFRDKRTTDTDRELVLVRIVSSSTMLLSTVDRIPLTTKIKSKSYFAFNIAGTPKISRAINLELYNPNIELWQAFTKNVKDETLSPDQKENISTIIYTAAISFCAVNDLFSTGDQKTPGTFFEHFISYIMKLSLKVHPVTEILVLDYDSQNVKLQTDRIFNLGIGASKFHIPIKTSTRERAIMLWAHQKLIDGVYGIEKFVGTPVLLAETKTDLKSKEVVEICLPDQWLVYQLYISRLRRIYYLDMPDAYKRLALATPPIHVKPLADFFFEWKEIYS